MMRVLLPNWTSYLLFAEDCSLVIIITSGSKREKKAEVFIVKEDAVSVLNATFTLGSLLSILSISNLFKQLPQNGLDPGGRQDLREI